MKFRILLILAAAAVMLCGCGGDDSRDNSNSSDNGMTIINDAPDDGLEWGELEPVE